MTQKFCDYLGVSSNASLDDIKHAYHKKALLLHPDRNYSERAKEEFSFLNDVYHLLLIEKYRELKKKKGKHPRSFALENVENILFAILPPIFIWLFLLLILDNASINWIEISPRLMVAVNLFMGVVFVSSMQFSSFTTPLSTISIPPLLRFLIGYSFSLLGFLLFRFQTLLIGSILSLVLLWILSFALFQWIAITLKKRKINTSLKRIAT